MTKTVKELLKYYRTQYPYIYSPDFKDLYNDILQTHENEIAEKNKEIEMQKEVSKIIIDDSKKENLISIAHFDYEQYLYINAEFDELIQGLEDIAFENTILHSDEIEDYWNENVKVLKSKINKLKSTQLYKEDFEDDKYCEKCEHWGNLDGCACGHSCDWEYPYEKYNISYRLKDNSKYDKLPSKEDKDEKTN